VKLSVVIAARHGSTPALRCVESLRASPRWGSFEVIVVNCLGVKAAAEFKLASAEVTLVAADPGWRIGRQRDAGVRKATGDIVAVLHERYQVPSGWVDAVLKTHASDYEVAAGAVIPGARLSAAAWAMYFSEYSHLCPSGASGALKAAEARMIPSGNVSYKRRAFSLADMASARSDLEFHSALFAAGARFFRETQMQATFGTPYSLREYIGERFDVSRDIAIERAIDLGLAQRCAAAGLRLALPGLILARVAARVCAEEDFRKPFITSLPWILVFGCVQMIGEMSGYLAR